MQEEVVVGITSHCFVIEIKLLPVLIIQMHQSPMLAALNKE